MSKSQHKWYLGDDEHIVCEPCCRAWVDDNTDADWNGYGYVRCSGHTEEITWHEHVLQCCKCGCTEAPSSVSVGEVI